MHQYTHAANSATLSTHSPVYARTSIHVCTRALYIDFGGGVWGLAWLPGIDRTATPWATPNNTLLLLPLFPRAPASFPSLSLSLSLLFLTLSLGAAAAPSLQTAPFANPIWDPCRRRLSTGGSAHAASRCDARRADPRGPAGRSADSQRRGAVRRDAH